MNRHSSQRDVTAKQASGGGGMSMAQRWLCGHTAMTGKRRPVLGRPAILWKCAACAEKGKA